MSQIDYLLIGPVVVDIVPGGRIVGGTVSYAASTAHAFGHRVGILTSAAAGEPLVNEMKPYANIVVKVAEWSTTYENVYDADGRTQYLHGAADNLTADFIPRGWFSAPLVHLAPLADRVDPNIVFDFPDATVLLTPQGWMRQWGADKRVHFKQWFNEEVVRAADIVVFSAEDIREAPELEQQYARVAKHLIVTKGRDGGIYYHNGEAMPYQAIQVTEVEPTGAGDVFASSLLSVLAKVNHDMQQAIQVAARIASRSVTRIGTNSKPSPTEIEQALNEVKPSG